MTYLFNAPISSITVWTSGGTIRARATNLTCEEPATEQFATAEIKIDHKWLVDQETGFSQTIDTGDSVAVWLGRSQDALYNVFQGRVWNVKKEIEGQEPRWVEFTAKGWGDELNTQWIGFKQYEDDTGSVIRWLIQPLVDAGRIQVGGIIDDPTSIVKFNHLQDELTVFSAVAEICEEKQWEFYVDQDRRFFAFPVNYWTETQNLDHYIKSSVYEMVGDEIINSQRVLGNMNADLGTDLLYTESAANWTSNADWIDAYNLEEGNLVQVMPDNNEGTGTYVIRFRKLDGSAGIWARHSLATTADLTTFGLLHFAVYYEFKGVVATSDIAKATAMKIRFETDSSNYFEYLIDVTGQDALKDEHLTTWYRYGWSTLSIPFNKKAVASAVTIVGNPSWDTIDSLYFEIYAPLPAAGDFAESIMYIDSMYFDGGYYYSFLQDSTSIAAYGERRGKLLYNSAYNSNAACNQVASAIIETYKNPYPKFTRVDLLDIPSGLLNGRFTPGYVQPITVSEITGSASIRKIIWELNEYDYNISLELSNVPFPTIDQLIAKLKAGLDELEESELTEDLNPEALFPFVRGPLGAEDLDIAHQDGNLLQNPAFEVDSNYDAIPDHWYPIYKIGEFRSENEVRSGQFSGKVTAQNASMIPPFLGNTMRSEYFPIDLSGSYIADGWMRAEHDGSESDISVCLEFYSAGPAPTKLGTTYIVQDVTPTTWSYFVKIFEKGDLPANTKYGRMALELKQNTGDNAYFDDLRVSRLMGVDAGLGERSEPKEYITTDTVYSNIWSTTIPPVNMMSKYHAERVKVEMQSPSGNPGYFRAIASELYEGGSVELYEWYWAVTETTYQLYTLHNEIETTHYGSTLVIDCEIKAGAYAEDEMDVRNIFVFPRAYSLVARMAEAYSGDDHTPE